MPVWWRFKLKAPGPWHYGWMVHLPGGLVRMGLYNGDTERGPVVDPSEIETREYR